MGDSVPQPTPGGSLRPDFQIESDRNLGNGSAAICDTQAISQGGGGVPGVSPLDFGPSNASNLLLFYIYETAFRFRNIGVANAATVILVLLLLVFTIANFAISERRANYG